MATFGGPYIATENLINVITASIDVGAATRDFFFKPLRRMEIVSLQSSVDAADSTDKVTWSLVSVSPSETIITGTVTDAAGEIIDVTTVDADKSSILQPGREYKLTATFAGTAANVKGVVCTLWAKQASHD